MRLVGRDALLALGLLCIGGFADAAEFSRCRMPDGSVSFVDGVCPATAEAAGSVAVATPDANPFLRTLGPWRCSRGADHLTEFRIPAEQAKSLFFTLPSAQSDSLKNAMTGLAMGRCGGGTHCEPKPWRLYRERNGVIFVCMQRSEDWSNRDTELRVTPKGVIYHRRGNDDSIRVTNPYADPRGEDFEYRVQLDGRRIERSRRESLIVVRDPRPDPPKRDD